MKPYTYVIHNLTNERFLVLTTDDKTQYTGYITVRGKDYRVFTFEEGELREATLLECSCD